MLTQAQRLALAAALTRLDIHDRQLLAIARALSALPDLSMLTQTEEILINRAHHSAGEEPFIANASTNYMTKSSIQSEDLIPTSAMLKLKCISLAK
jgi:hypothetical protein